MSMLKFGDPGARFRLRARVSTVLKGRILFPAIGREKRWVLVSTRQPRLQGMGHSRSLPVILRTEGRISHILTSGAEQEYTRYYTDSSHRRPGLVGLHATFRKLRGRFRRRQSKGSCPFRRGGSRRELVLRLGLERGKSWLLLSL
jgi:hypothetical protein